MRKAFHISFLILFLSINLLIFVKGWYSSCVSIWNVSIGLNLILYPLQELILYEKIK